MYQVLCDTLQSTVHTFISLSTTKRRLCKRSKVCTENLLILFITQDSINFSIKMVRPMASTFQHLSDNLSFSLSDSSVSSQLLAISFPENFGRYLLYSFFYQSISDLLLTAWSLVITFRDHNQTKCLFNARSYWTADLFGPTKIWQKYNTRNDTHFRKTTSLVITTNVSAHSLAEITLLLS